MGYDSSFCEPTRQISLANHFPLPYVCFTMLDRIKVDPQVCEGKRLSDSSSEILGVKKIGEILGSKSVSSDSLITT